MGAKLHYYVLAAPTIEPVLSRPSDLESSAMVFHPMEPVALGTKKRRVL